MAEKAHTLLARHRVNIPHHYLRMLEATGDPVRIRGTLYSRYTWRGVPGRYCDVIVADAIMGHRVSPDHVVLDVTHHRPQELPPNLVLEVGTKYGKYDGAGRRRYALRQFPADQIEAIPWADLRIVEQPDPTDKSGKAGELMIVIRPREVGEVPHVDTWPQYQHVIDPENIEALFCDQGYNFYRHLDPEVVREEARRWAMEVNATGAVANWTRAEAFRAASRRLYAVSRELGWRKLTAAEKERLFFRPDEPQWQRIETILPRYAALAGNDPEVLGHVTGTGEATRRAARADCSVHWTEPDDERDAALAYEDKY